jgi:hypothetical protein
VKSFAPANKSNTEDDDSLVQYRGMVGDDEDDEVERSVIVKDKGSKRGPSHCVRISLVHVSIIALRDKFSHLP